MALGRLLLELRFVLLYTEFRKSLWEIETKERMI